MTVRAGARDRQGEPDPLPFERFCRVIVPGVLTDVCHVGEELAAQVGEKYPGPRGILRSA